MTAKMQSSRKKRPITVLLIITAIFATVSVAAAFMLRRSEAQVDFAPAVVSCAVHEKVNGEVPTGTFATGEVKSDITVENAGSTAAYLRVRLSACWADKEGNITGTPSSLPEITPRQSWLDAGNGLYYYAFAVEPGQRTTVLCDPMELTTTAAPDGTAVYQRVTVLAEAVQALPEKAAQEAWGVTVTNGIITAVPTPVP